MITQTNKLKFTAMMRTTLLMLSGHLRQAGILLNLFPIKILLNQCKRLFSPLKARRDNTMKYCTTRQYEVLCKCFSLPESVGSKCLRAWGLRSKLGV